jgi:predicted permease
MDSVMQDVRQALRVLIKNPGFTLVAILTLALGIGANTAIFSMVDSFLMKPLPVNNPSELEVLVFQQKNGPLLNNFSVADYRDIRSQSDQIYSGLAAYILGIDGVKVSGKADRVLTNYVSGNYFSMLGIHPALGRFFLPNEGEVTGADSVMVLGYSYWQSQFGGDPNVIGRSVSVDGHPMTIIGVAPKGFRGAFTLVDARAFMPLGMAEIGGYPADFMEDRVSRNAFLLARLRPGTDLKSARASLAVIGERLSQQYPNDDKDMSLQAYPELQSRPNPDPNHTILIISGLFLGLAAMVLILACVNVANILLIRATVRGREMAIRAALGAGRSRLIRQLLTESIVLALAGGFAGMVFGYWGSSAVDLLNVPSVVPLQFDFGFDWRVFAFGFAAALVTGLIVGIVPAVRASRGNLAGILHEGGRGVIGTRQRLRTVLVVAQVAGSLMLLIIAGLFMRSLGEAQKTSLGFDPSHVLNLTMDPNEVGYSEAQSREFYKNLLERVRALPGVVSATHAAAVPMGYVNNTDTIRIEGYEPPPGQPEPFVFYNIVSPGYLETMGIPLERGRVFTEADNEKAKYVGIVSEAMAKRFWPKLDPMGRQFRIASDMSHPIEVVGIAKDARYNGMTGTIRPFFYVPFAQHFTGNSLETLQIKTAAAPAAMIPEVERVIESLAPDLPVFDVKTMTEALDTLNGMLIYQVGAVLAASLGLLGLVLAIVGVYGVVSFAASQKTHEIGIRMALGAEPLDILQMVFREGLVIIGIGLAVGIAGALLAGRVVGDFLAISPKDPFTYVSVSAILAVVALAACYVPARRAMRVDPMVALRHE